MTGMVKMSLSAIGLVIAGIVFFAYTQPTYDSVRDLQSQIAQYDQALQKASELQQLKQSLLSRYNAFNPADLDRLQKLLPDHVDNVRLVLDLDNLAGRHAMSLQNVVISNPATESDKITSALGAIGAGSQKYDSLTLRFSTGGTYQNFSEFLQDLEASLRIVDLVGLKIDRESEGPPHGEPTYRYDITIRTYWLK